MIKKLFAMIATISLFALVVSPISADSEHLNNAPEMVDPTVTFDFTDFATKKILTETAEDGSVFSIELVSVEDDKIQPYASTGDSGWSIGYFPSGTVVLKAKASSPDGAKFEYWMTAVNGVITDTYNLTYTLPLLWSIKSYTLTNTSTRASLAFNAEVRTTWTGVKEFAGYLTYQVNSARNVRVTWSI